MLRWGHRGTRRGALENTLSAFELALSQGADGIELDARACNSGELVVLHDPDLMRVAGDPRVVADLDWQTLCDLELRDGQRLPSLNQALALVLAAGKRLNIELKTDTLPPASIDALPGLLADELSTLSDDARASVVVSSFHGSLCRALGSALPDVSVARLCSRPVDDLSGLSGVHPRYDLVTEAEVRRWHASGLFVHVWTVNDGREACRLRDCGVDGLITDDLPLIGAALAAPAAR